MQRDLIAEEYQEFRYSMREGFEQELKELADLVYVCFQYAENMEWDLEEALDRVHKFRRKGSQRTKLPTTYFERSCIWLN